MQGEAAPLITPQSCRGPAPTTNQLTHQGIIPLPLPKMQRVGAIASAIATRVSPIILFTQKFSPTTQRCAAFADNYPPPVISRTNADRSETPAHGTELFCGERLKTATALFAKAINPASCAFRLDAANSETASPVGSLPFSNKFSNALWMASLETPFRQPNATVKRGGDQP